MPKVYKLKRCRSCGNEFMPKRKDATYCSYDCNERGRGRILCKVHGEIRLLKDYRFTPSESPEHPNDCPCLECHPIEGIR